MYVCIYVNSVNNVTYVSSDHFLVDFLNLISRDKYKPSKITNANKPSLVDKLITFLLILLIIQFEATFYKR